MECSGSSPASHVQGRCAVEVASGIDTALISFDGVGSVTWFAAAIALPFLVWGARRHERERVVAIVVDEIRYTQARLVNDRGMLLHFGPEPRLYRRVHSEKPP